MTHVHVAAVRSIRIVVEESNQKIYPKKYSEYVEKYAQEFKGRGF